MKSKMIVLSILLAGFAQNVLAQQIVRGSRPTSSQEKANTPLPQKRPNTDVAVLPDLVVTSFDYPKPNTIRVQVMNEGGANSKPCFLALMVLKSDSISSDSDKVFSVAIPSLKAHKGYWATINIAPFTSTDRAFLARVDRSDQVKESNESNNDRFDNSKVIH